MTDTPNLHETVTIGALQGAPDKVAELADGHTNHPAIGKQVVGPCPSCGEHTVEVADGYAECTNTRCTDRTLADHQYRVLGTGVAAEALTGT